MRWRKGTISLAECLYAVWYSVEHDDACISSEELLPPFSNKGTLSSLIRELCSYNLQNKPIEEIKDNEIEANFQKKVATIFIPHAEFISRCLEKLLIDISTLNSIQSSHINEPNKL